MSFDADLINAISQGNEQVIKAFNLTEKQINQRMSVTSINQGQSNFFQLPPVPFPTPIVYAICCRQSRLVSFFIEKGARLDTSINGWYPIHYAVASQHAETINALINNSDPETELARTTERDQATPMHIAVSGGQYEIVALLISLGANIDASNAYGDSPLHLAMVLSDDIIARTLIASRANRNSKNKSGKTPADVAQAANNIDLALIMRRYEDGNIALPTPEEIEMEMAEQDASKIRKKNRRRAIHDEGANNEKIEGILTRLNEYEARCERLEETINKLKSTPLTQRSHMCESCFREECTQCPTCKKHFCETCIKKARIHRCVSNQRI